jgi:hypothetical protein
MRSLSTRAAGLVILILGLWGGLVPFIGPYFHYSLGPTKSWTYTTGRLWLDILPAAAAVLGGLMLINAGWRPHARLGALLALAAGIWFVIGPDISHLWNAAGAQGVAHGSPRLRMLESLGYHTGLGVLITALAAYILPRFPAVARDAAAERALAADRGVAPRERGVVAGERGVAPGERGVVAGDRGIAPGERGRGVARDEMVADRGGAPGERGRGVARDEMAADEPATRREPLAADEPAGARSAGTAPDGGGDPYATGGSGIDTATADRAGQYGHSGPVRRRRRGGLLSMLSRR